MRDRVIDEQLEADESVLARVTLGAQQEEVRARRHLYLTNHRLLLWKINGVWRKRTGQIARQFALNDIVRIEPHPGTRKHTVHLKVTSTDGTTDSFTVMIGGPQGISLYNLLLKLRKLRPDINESPMQRPHARWRWVYAAAGVVCVAMGGLIGHGAGIVWNEAHEPNAIAIVDSQSCWDDQSDQGDEELCNVKVHYKVAGREVQSTMGAIAQADIYQLSSTKGVDAIQVAYPPSHVNLIVPSRENTDRLALLFGGMAALFLGLAYLCVRPIWRYRIDKTAQEE